MTLVSSKEFIDNEAKLSDMFRGMLSKDSAESFNQQIKEMREEWDDI